MNGRGDAILYVRLLLGATAITLVLVFTVRELVLELQRRRGRWSRHSGRRVR